MGIENSSSLKSAEPYLSITLKKNRRCQCKPTPRLDKKNDCLQSSTCMAAKSLIAPGLNNLAAFLCGINFQGFGK